MTQNLKNVTVTSQKPNGQLKYTIHTGSGFSDNSHPNPKNVAKLRIRSGSGSVPISVP